MTEHATLVPQPPHQRTQMEWEQVPGTGCISYLSEGPRDTDSVPILFLHGLGGGARLFQGQLTHLAPRYHALAWDMPGYGRSVPLPLVTMDALAASLAAFIAALGLDRPVLVGHSFGGMLAQRLLADAPHVVRALVLCQTSAAFGGRDPAWADDFIHTHLAPLDAGHSLAELAPARIAAMTAPGADLGAAPLALAFDCLAHTPAATYRDTLLAMRGFDLRAGLLRIAVPTLVLAGTHDALAPSRAMQRMAHAIPGARYVELPTGHLAHLERPQAFEAALDAFLAQL